MGKPRLPLMVVEELDRVSIATDRTRRSILERLVEREMTSRELSELLAISQQLAYHHLQKLIEAGMVEVCAVDRRGNRDVYFYRAVAEHIRFELPEISPKVGSAPAAPAALSLAPVSDLGLPRQVEGGF